MIHMMQGFGRINMYLQKILHLLGGLSFSRSIGYKVSSIKEVCDDKSVKMEEGCLLEL